MQRVNNYFAVCGIILLLYSLVKFLTRFPHISIFWKNIVKLLTEKLVIFLTIEFFEFSENSENGNHFAPGLVNSGKAGRKLLTFWCGNGNFWCLLEINGLA